MKQDIPLFPVAGWSIGPIESQNLVAIKFDFLTNFLQLPSEANEGRHYVLTPPQAAELVQKIQQALQHLETHGHQAPPDQKH